MDEMKMKMKILKIITAVIILILFCSNLALAAGSEETTSQYYEEQLQFSGAQELKKSLPDETQKMLEQIGIEKVDFYTIFDASPRKIIDLFINILRGRMNHPLATMTKIMGILVLMALANSFAPDGEKVKLAINITCTAFVLLLLISPLSSAITAAVSSVSALSGFMLVLIPVLAGIITASGNPLLAMSFNTVAFSGAQGISQLIRSIVVPCTGIVMAMGSVGAMTPDFKLDEIAELFKKVVIAVFSFIVTMFSAFLSIKGVMANAADTVAAKGIKLSVNSAIQILGSTLSDSSSSRIGSLSLVKSAVGVFGICSVLLISAPIIIELTIWSLGLKVVNACSKMLGLEGIDSLFNAIGSSVMLLNICLIFNMFLMTITIGITLAIRAGI